MKIHKATALLKPCHVIVRSYEGTPANRVPVFPIRRSVRRSANLKLLISWLKVKTEIAFSRLVFLARHIIPGDKKVVLIAADVPATNLGDQALTLGAISYLYKHHSKVSLYYASNEYVPVGLLEEFAGLECREEFTLAFTTPYAFTDRLKLLWSLRDVEAVFAIGADVYDGSYNPREIIVKLDVLNLIANTGASTRIVSASFSEEIDSDVSGRLAKHKAHVGLCARDDFSLARVREHHDGAVLTADAAFMMQPASRFLGNELDSSTQPIIGLCIKAGDLKATEDSRQAIRNTIARIQQMGIRLVALPHHPNDVLAMKSLIDDFNGENWINPEPTLLDAPTIKYLAKHCELVITGRMHVAIAALGTGTPAVCFHYGGKFEGLMKHFDLEWSSFLQDRSSPYFAEQLWEKIVYCLDHNREIRAEVSAAWPKVEALSMRNFRLS